MFAARILLITLVSTVILSVISQTQPPGKKIDYFCLIFPTGCVGIQIVFVITFLLGAECYVCGNETVVFLLAI